MRNFIQGIKNLIRWFPVIWKDRDYDDHFIWELLKFKIRNQAEYIGSKDRYVSAKRDAEIMMLCYRLMDDIQHEHYQSEYSDYHESKSIFTPSEKFPGHYEWNLEEISERFDEYFCKYPRIYNQVIDSEKNIFKTDSKLGIAMNIAHINHDRARKLLFKILENNIERWWD